MYGRTRAPFWEAVLSLLSMPYRLAVKTRHTLYALRILKRNRLSCAVISVGNITLGGTGKTPAVVQIAELLLRQHAHPLVVSRGYGREDEKIVRVVSDGTALLVDARTGGDEPVLIASKLSTVPVVVGRDRYRAALAACSIFQPDVVLLDDGFQHLQLQRTLDIVLIDARDPFGNGKLFPAGILREPIQALRRAHAVLITGVEDGTDLTQLKHIIWGATRAPIFTSRQVPVDLIDCISGETKPLSTLRGSRILAFSGIARPASFAGLLRSLDAVLENECIYPDHYTFTRSDLAQVYKLAADHKVSMIITTEKDAVRLKTLRPEGIWSLRIELRVNEQNAWERLLLNGL